MHVKNNDTPNDAEALAHPSFVEYDTGVETGLYDGTRPYDEVFLSLLATMGGADASAVDATQYDYSAAFTGPGAQALQEAAQAFEQTEQGAVVPPPAEDSGEPSHTFLVDCLRTLPEFADIPDFDLSFLDFPAQSTIAPTLPVGY